MTRSPFDKDGIRRVIELSESPALKLAREMEKTSIARLARDSSSISRLAKDAENSAAMRAAWMLEQNDHLQKLTASVTQQAAALQKIDQILRDSALAANQTIIPFAEQLRHLSVTAAQAVQPLQAHFEHMETWQTSLASRMAELTTPWALEDHLEVSVVGFARIARLHDISTGSAPFDPVGGEIFEEELGSPVPFNEDATPDDRESARIDAGLNPEVIAFPPSSYSSVLFSAGFELRIEAIAPIRSDGGDDSGSLDPQYASLFSQVENRLRAVIEAELRKLAGARWQRTRVHGNTCKKWQDRKTKDHDQRGDSYSLLYYADFMELSDVICQGNNWNEAFQRFFRSKSDFQVSMQRLCPVRNAIGHNRPLVRADQVTLFGEGFRILNALGVRLH